MRVAIVHYWLLNQRGGEAVLDSLCRLLPDADIFTLFYDLRARARRSKATASPRRFSIRCEALRCLAAAHADSPREFRPARLRLDYQQRIGSGQGRTRALHGAPHLLLPHSPAIPVGPVSSLFVGMDSVSRKTRSNGAARELFAAVGFCFGFA